MPHGKSISKAVIFLCSNIISLFEIRLLTFCSFYLCFPTLQKKTMATESTSRVLEALSSLYSSTDQQSNREASRWLEAFQKKVL
jgi:hypothetical protein